MKSIELRQEYWRILSEARAVVERAETENRNLSAEEQTQWQKAQEGMKALDERIKRQELLEATPDEDEEHRSWLIAADRKAGPPQTEEEEKDRQKRAYADAFREYIRLGEARMSEEGLATLQMRGVKFSKEEQATVQRFQQSRPEFRAQEVGSQTLGGFWVPEEVFQRIEKAMLFFGGMRQSGAEVITTDSGADLPWPVYDDTGNTGRRLAENAAFTETDLAVGIRVMKAYMYSSDEVLVSRQFLQDVPIRAETWLADALGERIGRITNTEMTTYAGADGPQGLIRASTLGVTAAGTATVTADELLTLQYAINRVYRTGGRYMMADATLRTIMQLKDGEGRYLFIPDPRAGGEPALHGWPVVVNNDMPALATGNITIEAGNFSHYKIRDVMGFTVLRLDEIRARNLQVVFLGFSRHDGAYINAGQNPIQHLIQA